MDRSDSQILLTLISDALVDLERSEDIMICSATPNVAANKLHQAVRQQLLEAPLSARELHGIFELLREVLYGGPISRPELSTRAGLTPEEFEALLKKLPRE